MKINAIKCKLCGDIIYSRAKHDMRYCSCGTHAIDGGFNYNRIVFKKAATDFDSIEIDSDVTRQELFEDWNNNINKYGLIKGGV